MTRWNVDRLMQGSSDIAMLPEGYEQARAAGQVLAELGGWRQLVSSPLGRARATAQEIGPSLGIEEVGTDPRLVERDFGEAEGMPVVEAHERWPESMFAGSEPAEETARRGAEAVTEWAEQPGVVLVAHGTLIRLAVGRLLGEAFVRLPNAAVVVAQRRGDVWNAELAGQPDIVPLT